MFGEEWCNSEARLEKEVLLINELSQEGNCMWLVGLGQERCLEMCGVFSMWSKRTDEKFECAVFLALTPSAIFWSRVYRMYKWNPDQIPFFLKLFLFVSLGRKAFAQALFFFFVSLEGACYWHAPCWFSFQNKFLYLC